MLRNSLLKVVLIFSFLFLGNFVFANEPPPDACTAGVCCNTAADPNEFYGPGQVCNSWVEYGCPWGNGCGSDVGVITYTQYCSGSSVDCNGSVTDSGWSVATNCNSWQACVGSSCQCAGSCLEIPTNPSPANGAENVKLPVTLGWGSVSGANSYRYKIDGVLEDYTANTQKTIDEVGSCLLKSNTNYNWGVKACCSSDGTDGTKCGNWSGWTLKTSLAPQLLLPPNNTTNAVLPVSLNWCDVAGSQSYCLRSYRTGMLYFPFIIEKEEDAPPAGFVDESSFFTKDTTYEWEIAACSNEHGIRCGVSCTDSQDCSACGDYSPRWSFTTVGILSVPQLTAPFYNPSNPNEIPTVNTLHSLEWKYVRGARSYDYEVKKESGDTLSIPDSYLTYEGATSLSVSFNNFWSFLEFDKPYTWRIRSCWDEVGANCEDEWSAEWKFKTTGAKPENLNTDNTIIPVKLDWDNMPSAASYYYEVATDSGFTDIVIPEPQRVAKNSEVLVDYPHLHQDTLYYWRVKTCADEKGEVCGEWSDVNGRSFKTFKLAKPINPYPADGGELPTYEHYLQWGKVDGARTYQYKVDFGGTEKIPLTLVSSNSTYIATEKLSVDEYTWYVRACLDKDCNEAGESSDPWRFNLVEKPPPGGGGGIVPCGRYANTPDPYDIDERESCQFKHIFLLLRNIIDFVLWRLGLIVLVSLVAATGVVFYFSMGAPETMVKVKTILKSAGTGYAILFLSWTFIDIILKILGYKVGLPWWQLQF